MLLERHVPKEVDNLKLQIEIFALEISRQTNRKTKQTKKDKIVRHEIVDYFICSANAHAIYFFASIRVGSARTVWL